MAHIFISYRSTARKLIERLAKVDTTQLPNLLKQKEFVCAVVVLIAALITIATMLMQRMASSTLTPLNMKPLVQQTIAIAGQQLIDMPTPTPLSAATKRTDAHGIAQVWVPAGCFMMGSDPDTDKNAQVDEYPTDTKKPFQICFEKGFWIDEFEVTNAAYQQFMDAGGYTTQEYWTEAGWQWKADNQKSGPNDHGVNFNNPTQPRVGITWYEAQAYAAWRGARLPTEAEWEYAARGPQSLLYPWGNTFDGTKANYCDKQCDQSWADKTIDDGYRYTAPVGSLPAGQSWVGAQDIAGNVWEWTSTLYQPYPYRAKDGRESDESNGNRAVRSGSWYGLATLLRASYRYGSHPANEDRLIGFRCASTQ